MTFAAWPLAFDDTEETSFLRSTPWILDAHLQNPDQLLNTLRLESPRLKELIRLPRFSVLAVMHDCRPQHLRELILSIRCQSYENWELILVDDGSRARAHLEVARAWADRDPRIRLIAGKGSMGPSRSKNLAVRESTGDYLIVTEPDGLLHPMVLGVFARHLNDHPALSFMFSNEAEIDHRATGLTNFFVKPPFDRFTLLRIPYIGRPFAASRALVEQAAQNGPVFRHQYDGIEDHDLCLRLALAEGFESHQTPLFGYYRRAGSHVITGLTGPDLFKRRQRLAEEFTPRLYPGATFSITVPKSQDPLAATSVWLSSLPGWAHPKLLIVIPFKDQVETTIHCLESIERQEHTLDVLVALVDNRSSRTTTLPTLRSWIAEPRTARYQIIDHPGAFNFAQLNNRAVATLGADRDLVLLLNNDVELSMSRTLQTMAMQVLADPMIGFLGIKLYYPGEDEIQHGGIRFGEFTCGSGYHEVKHCKTAAEFVDAERISTGVTFACAMTRRQTFQKLGGLDEIYLPNGFGDVSMCLSALEAGYRNYYLGSISGIHHESKSRAFANEDAEFSFLNRRHGQAIATWRHWHLIRSYRYAWPLLVLPFNYPPPPGRQKSIQAASGGSRDHHIEGTAQNCLPLRYRAADRVVAILKGMLGPFYGLIRGRVPRLFGAATALRRFLKKMPLIAGLARRARNEGRRIMYRARVLIGLLKVLCRNPDAAQVLKMGLANAGLSGLRQSIRLLVPVVNDADPSPQAWFDATRPTRSLLARFRRREWPAQAPKITVLTAVYNVKEEWLREAVESVIAQTYPHWEMICVNDHSTAPHIRPALDELAARDRRVRVIHCAENRGVSVATNRGLALATGDYVAFMDHDDRLEPHALHRFAEAVLQDNPDLIYSDEVMTQPDSDRVLALACRPSFSYDYYLCHPYFVHFLAARSDIVRRVGGLNEEMTISQDVDLSLRLFEACRKVAHVPEILYRWRTHPASLGHQQQEKVSAMTRGALERHFTRIGVDVDIDDSSNFNFRDMRFAATEVPRVAIIIAASGQETQLSNCLASLAITIPADLTEIVIVDRFADQPAMNSVLKESTWRHQILRCDGELDSATLLNRGAAAARAATHYLFLHEDTEAINQGWLEHMIGYAQRPDIGIVGATLLFRDDTIQHAGKVLGLNGPGGHVLENEPFFTAAMHRSPGRNGVLLASRDVSAVTAACMLVRADVFLRLAGFDQEQAGSFQDLDLCLRARAIGYKVIQDAYALLYHDEADGEPSSVKSGNIADLRRFLARHGDSYFAGDPFYSPLLSTNSSGMRLSASAKTRASVRCRTARIVLPGKLTGSRSFRHDTPSPPGRVVQPARPGVAADRFV